MKHVKLGIETYFFAYLGFNVIGLCTVVRALVRLYRATSETEITLVLVLLAATAGIGLSVWVRAIMIRGRGSGSAVAGALAGIASLGFVLRVDLVGPYAIPVFGSAVLACWMVTSTGRALALSAIVAAAHVLSVALVGRQELIVGFLIAFVVLTSACALVGGALKEWQAQTKLFDQAQWASVHMSRANMHLQDDLYRLELLSRTEERIRIAREIHDTVGYTLTAVLVQINAAQEVLRVRPESVRPRLRALEDLVRSAMQEVRDEVSALREHICEFEGWRDRWLRLCETFSESTGVRVHLEVEESLGDIDDTHGEVIYRVLQESLTNAYRHGRAEYVDVVIGMQNGQILIRISDNGRGAEAVQPGNGLNGMRERIERLNGRVVWQSRPEKGFDIGIEFPYSAEEVELEENTSVGG